MSMSLEDATMSIQSQLVGGESIAWIGKPNSSVIFHKQDLFLIPFSLLWGGFAIFWEGSVAGFWNHGTRNGAWIFGMIWGIPFVVIGQYLIWGRFIYDLWLKGRTYYAVTNRRVIVLQKGWSQKIVAAHLDSVPALTKEGSDAGPGTLSFAPNTSFFSGFQGASSSRSRQGWGAWNSMSIAGTPIFRDIDNLDYVYRIVSDLREKARSSGPSRD
jgi:hypothetical protein